MKIFSDFSDTIALPKIGGKFPPFELELGKMVEDTLTPGPEKEAFNAEYHAGYENFSKIRRDDSIPYEARAKTWLDSFAGKLSTKHLDELAETFKLNENFPKTVNILKQTLALPTLQITIVSGTITQLIESFLKKINLPDCSFQVEATKLVFNPNGVFTGEIAPTNKIVYIGPPAYPTDYLIFGDNALESFGGFGDHLLNVQSPNLEEIKKRIGKLL